MAESKKSPKPVVKTFANDSKLPPLPVPPLRETINKYLQTVIPHATAEELNRTKSFAEEFLKPGGDGERLQLKLQKRSVERWECKANWLEDWWYQYAYLKWPDPITIGSNFYVVFDEKSLAVDYIPPAYQAARLIYGLVQFKHLLDREELPAEYMGQTPLCMNMYRNLFTTSRTPGLNGDSLMMGLTPSNEVLVISKRQLYTVSVYHKDGSVLSVRDLELQIKRIQEDSSAYAESASKVNGVGVGTATVRPEWAKIRQLISMDAVNHEILQRIEKAMFVVCLDDATPQSYDEQAFHIIGGDANNRWFDKVCQLIIFSNGKAGINGEHSPLDATVYVPLLEFVLIKYARQLGTNGYPDDLQTDPSLLPKPQKLQWKISPMISEMLQSAEAEYMKRWKNTDVKLLFCREAGTALLKKLKISPDSFVQIALQLAYYRMYGVPCATYETGQTRQFYHGRTETVRSCSVESVEFTKAMVSPEHNNESRLQLFKKAVESHKRYMIDAVSGKACDRHLFGLKLLALEEVQEGKLKQLPAIFTDPMYAKSTYYKLSTSNIPGTSTFCGGFGNVVKDGYGCCYITRPDVFIFGIVSDYSCDTTDSLKMKQAINDAVRDIIKLFPAPPSSKL